MIDYAIFCCGPPLVIYYFTSKYDLVETIKNKQGVFRFSVRNAHSLKQILEFLEMLIWYKMRWSRLYKNIPYWSTQDTSFPLQVSVNEINICLEIIHLIPQIEYLIFQWMFNIFISSEVGTEQMQPFISYWGKHSLCYHKSCFNKVL